MLIDNKYGKSKREGRCCCTKFRVVVATFAAAALLGALIYFQPKKAVYIPCSPPRATKNEKVLITGVAGFIGSHVGKHLVNLGFNVVGIDDMSGGFKENIPKGVEFVKGDFTDVDFLHTLWEEHGPFEYIYHIGAYAAEGLSFFISVFNYETNLVGSQKLINYAIRNGTKSFVFTSSIAAYGALTPPFKETMDTKPEDPYGISKNAVEQDLRAKHEMFGLNFIIFRPHNVYGPNQNIFDKYRNVIGIFMYNAIHNLPLRIFGDGLQTRAFSYIDDVAPYIAQAPLMEGTQNQVFNIGADQPYTLKELASTVKDALEKHDVKGISIKHEPPRLEVQHAEASHLKFKRCFKPSESVGLKPGIDAMTEWVMKNGRGYHPVTFEGLELNEGKLPPSWSTDKDFITDRVHVHTDNGEKN